MTDPRHDTTSTSSIPAGRYIEPGRVDGLETRWQHRNIERDRGELGKDVAVGLLHENHDHPEVRRDTVIRRARDRGTNPRLPLELRRRRADRERGGLGD